MIKKFIVLLIFIGVILFTSTIYHIYLHNNLSQTFIVNINKMSGCRNFIHEIDENAYNSKLRKFYLPICAYLNFFGYLKKIQKGEYYFHQNENLLDLMNKITKGQTIVYKFNIIPGSSWHNIKIIINDLPVKIDELFLKKYENLSLEGFFWAETYFFNKGDSLIKILDQARDLFLLKSKQIWESRAKELKDLTFNDFVIIASLIEKEAKDENDKPLIARVIFNRLNKDMRLQIDATTVYWCEKHNLKFSYKSLKEKNSYNTYLHKGLPPSPISYPSISSLNAAAHPAAGNWMFYRLNCNKHVFSNTFDEHKRAGCNE